MDAIEIAIAEGRQDDVPRYFSDKWLGDNTLFGPAAKVREGAVPAGDPDPYRVRHPATDEDE